MTEIIQVKNGYKISEVFGDIDKSWGWIMTLGILFIVLGTIGLGVTAGLTLVSVLFFGWLLIIGGAFQLVHTFKVKRWRSMSWQVLMAALYIGAGVVVVYDPVGAAIALTAFIAAIFFALGLIRIIIAFQIKGISGWWWPLVGGFASIILASVIVIEWPSSALWVIGLFIAIDMIVHGWTFVMIAAVARGATIYKI
jgi:uncharacterized membrane protein HdeD (DUF308 family)